MYVCMYACMYVCVYVYMYVHTCVCMYDKTEYIVMSQYQNAGQSHNIKIVNSSNDRAEQFKYFKILFRKKLRAD